MRIAASLTIGRPAAIVFDFLTAWENIPRWEAGVQEAAQTTPGPPGVGARGRDRRRFLGRTTETAYEVTAYEPPRVFGVRSLSGPVPVRASYTLAPVPGGTRLDSVADFGVGGPMRLLAPLLGRVIQRQHERDLRRLKALLEAEPHG
jgi:uncharacterized protein YndB with AHSA1/START domain